MKEVRLPLPQPLLDSSTALGDRFLVLVDRLWGSCSRGWKGYHSVDWPWGVFPGSVPASWFVLPSRGPPSPRPWGQMLFVSSSVRHPSRPCPGLPVSGGESHLDSSSMVISGGEGGFPPHAQSCLRLLHGRGSDEPPGLAWRRYCFLPVPDLWFSVFSGHLTSGGLLWGEEASLFMPGLATCKSL